MSRDTSKSETNLHGKEASKQAAPFILSEIPNDASEACEPPVALAGRDSEVASSSMSIVRRQNQKINLEVTMTGALPTRDKILCSQYPCMSYLK